MNNGVTGFYVPGPALQTLFLHSTLQTLFLHSNLSPSEEIEIRSVPHLVERDAALPGELLLDLLRRVRVGQVGVEVLVQHLINGIIN